MSWFDAAGLANIAKSALKEAQRTIDKALDIKDNGINEINNPSSISNDDFFGTWVVPPPLKEQENLENVQSSIWGSFTGSFFDHSREYNKSISLEGLDDTSDINSEQFSQSKLVVENDDSEAIPLENEENSIIQEDNIYGPMKEILLIDNEILEEKTLKDVSIENYQQVENQVSNEKGVNQPMNSLEEITTDQLNDEMVYTSSDDTKVDLKMINVHPKEQLETSPCLKDDVLTLVQSTSQVKDNIDAQFNISPTKKNLPEAITVPPGRNNVQLSLSQDNNESILIDTQPQTCKQDISNILKNTNIIDIPLEDDCLSRSYENYVEVSDKENIQDSEVTQNVSCKSNATDSNTTYLQHLLAEAISDKESISANTCIRSDSNSIPNDGISSENLSIIQFEMSPRENSPLSSDKSDLVKIGSDHTSGHTSGDELETGTSSDIEIISSPNGDSSSTQSRQSPAKQIFKKITKDECQVDNLLCKMAMKSAKGHTRELSGASSLSDDSHSSEIEKLVRKITEMTEILESRETKLVDINRKNVELQELNMELKNHLNSILSKQLESQDLTQVTEEYAQRMSVLEKKFQQSIREIDTLRKQLEQARQESASRLSKGEFDSMIFEKEEMIKQLREEGEKLSKQQLQHSNIIKKLRAKEKENETKIKQLKEKVEELTSETDRLKRLVNAKEEVERTQIEAVNQLTSKNKKLENDFAKIQSEFEDQLQKYETLKKSLEAARKELSDKNKITNQLTAKEQLLENLESEKKVAESQNEDVINQLQYLRMKLHEYESEYLKKESILRQENSELLQRLENAESRNEELSQSVLEVSKPLVRQLESLQATHNLKMAHFEKIELNLTSKVKELQFRLTSTVSKEKTSKEECMRIRSEMADLEVEYNSLKHQRDLLQVQLEQIKTESFMLEQELKSKLEELHSDLKEKSVHIAKLNEEISTLKSSLEKSLEELNRKELSVVSSIKHDLDEHLEDSNSNPRSTSPTLSVGKASVADSLASSLWSQIESFDAGHVPRYTNMFEIQMLQSNLQQREGELQQLQWELNRREQERNLMNSELTSLTSKVDKLTKNEVYYESIKVKFEELQRQYDVLCEMYGEKVDEVEELRLDLLEAKEAYKSQLDELLGNQNVSTS